MGKKEKKGFMMYKDLSPTIHLLTDEQAGQLFKIILEYVNNQDPVIEDNLLKITFEPIKQTLKRDLVKYEEKCQKNTEYGKLGGRPKKIITTS